MKITIETDGDIKNVEALKSELEAVVSKHEEEEQLKYNDVYWFLAGDYVGQSIWENYGRDLERKKRGNAFRTEEEAKLAEQKRIALNTICDYWKENCKWEVDWNDAQQRKWAVHYEHDKRQLGVRYFNVFHHCPFLPVYQSPRQAEQAIKDLTPEYKLLFDVV